MKAVFNSVLVALRKFRFLLLNAQCAKCNCIIMKDFLTSKWSNKTYHLGCARAYLGSKSARGCCLASLSNSHQRSSLTTMTEQVHNTASGMPSGLQTPLFSFSSESTSPQQPVLPEVSEHNPTVERA